MKLSRSRWLTAGILSAVMTAGFAGGTAQAALLTGSAPGCTNNGGSQVFLPWADVSHYNLVPGGSFESGAAGWSLSGGAGVTAGNESFYVNGSGDSNSLSMPAGSSATTATFCVGIQNPTIRMFAENTGNPASTMAVSVNFVGPLGLPLTAQIATVTGSGSWEPTAAMPIVVNLLTLLPGNMTPVSLTFTPQGAGGAWSIDDVYVDPYGRS